MERKTKSGPKQESRKQNLPDSTVTAPKTTVASEPSNEHKFSKRRMASNWEKYDEPSDVIDIGYGSRHDFGQFVGKNATAGDSHFRFSKEKDWASQMESTSDYLKLNIKDLCADILCVPLHERLRLKPANLTAEQIESFNKEAQQYESRRKKQLVPLEEELNSRIVTLLVEDMKPPVVEDSDEPASCASLWAGQNSAEKQQPTWEDSSTSYFNMCGIDDELDSLLSMPQPSKALEGTQLVHLHMLNIRFD